MRGPQKFLILLLPLLLLTAATPGFTSQGREYPRLANYYLKWKIEKMDVADLAKYDLLVLDMEVQNNSRENLKAIRKLNPDIKILAYITSQEANPDIRSLSYAREGSMRQKLADGIDDSWWLRNSAGQRLSSWPGTYLLNVSDACPTNASGQQFNDYLANFVNDKILSTGLWDGVFYDNLWGDVVWAAKDISIASDGQIRSVTDTNNSWARGATKLLQKTRDANPDIIILGNAGIYYGYQPHLNGMMFENFPSPWENGGTWSGSMQTFSNLKKYNLQPQISLINIYNHDQANYRLMRFGLGSSLLDNHGYFSYDYDVSSPGQIWWYDEYDVNLGRPLFPAYNTNDKSAVDYPAGFYRRDFENGTVFVNSSPKTVRYIFPGSDEMEKINGTQDRSVNNGTVVNFVKVNSKDSVILLKRNTQVIGSSFYNGNFARVFDASGHQVRSGFFTYLDNFAGNAPVLAADFNGDGDKEYLTAGGGAVAFIKDGKSIVWQPFGKKYKGDVTIAATDFNNNGDYEIINGSGKGIKPQVVLSDLNGKTLKTFLAYSSSFSGGINVAAASATGNDNGLIITGPKFGLSPEVRIFDKNGKLLKSFLAYDKGFKGGVSVAVGDVNGDGAPEIITGPGAGGGPDVRIFSLNGKLLGHFLAYEAKNKAGLKILVEDINNDGQAEILASTINF